MLVDPVTLPPGRARLSTRPEPTRSPAPAATIGIVLDACLAARVAWVPYCHDDICSKADQFDSETGQTVELTLRPSVLK